MAETLYLTAKTITRTVAEEALAILRERGLYFRSVTITAKEKLCILEKPCVIRKCARVRKGILTVSTMRCMKFCIRNLESRVR